MNCSRVLFLSWLMTKYGEESYMKGKKLKILKNKDCEPLSKT